MAVQGANCESERALLESWRGPLLELCNEVRSAARAAVARALSGGSLTHLARPVAQGAGDVTFGLDEATERVVRSWFAEESKRRPLSLLTEDTGWLHRGPGAHGSRELPDFDHGGPRIAIDPIDGTRHLMADLRSAWTILSCAGAGPLQPRFSDLGFGIAAEIPDSRAARWRRLEAFAGAPARWAELDLESPRIFSAGELRSDREVRADHGYYLFFSYHPGLRVEVASLAARFFANTERALGADLSHCYDDQYISSGGQLALLSLSTYRMVVEARNTLARYHHKRTQCAKPYDMAGAALIARMAGCVVEQPTGEPLDFALDAETPVDFAAYVNEESAARLRPHLLTALKSEQQRAKALPQTRDV